MSKPPEMIQIRPEDFSKEDRSVGVVLAGLLNNFLLQIIQLLNKTLTFTDNFNAEVRTLTMKGGSPVTFKLESVGSPRGLTLQKFLNTTDGTEILSIPVSVPQWSFDGKGNITVQPIPGFTASENYSVTFLIISG